MAKLNPNIKYEPLKWLRKKIKLTLQLVIKAIGNDLISTIKVVEYKFDVGS